MRVLLLIIVLVAVAGCSSESETTSTTTTDSIPGSAPGLGSIQYISSFSFAEFFGGDTATVTVDVKERGFTFRIAVTSPSLFVCEFSQGVIQDGRRVNLNSFSFSGPLEFDSENYVPFNYDGCDTLFPSINAYGDVYMAGRMSMDAARSFQFIFDDFESGGLFTLTPP